MDISIKKTRRHWLKASCAISVVATALPNRWVTPVISSVVLPAHAMTSNACGNFVAEPVNDMIGMVVTATEVQGPITLPLTIATSTNFSGSESTNIGTCANGDQQRQDVSFTGNIDSVANQITGTLDIDIFCGSLLVCQQSTTYVVDQIPAVMGDDAGAYQGQLTGTLSCCEQSASILSLPLNGRSLIR